MKKTQFTEQQIIAMLKQHEQGVKASDIARAWYIRQNLLSLEEQIRRFGCT